MKKRIVTSVLATMLALSVAGCGNSAEPKQVTQQEEQAEQKEETKQEEAKADVDMGGFVFYAEIGEAKYGIKDSNFIPLEESITFTTTRDTNVWNIDGKNVGYIKPGVIIEINDHGEDIAWYY